MDLGRCSIVGLVGTIWVVERVLDDPDGAEDVEEVGSIMTADGQDGRRGVSDACR